MNRIQWLTISVLVLVVLEVLLFECGWMEMGLLQERVTLKYGLDMLGAALTVGLIPWGMRLRQQHALRVTLLGAVIIVNLLIYYLCDSSTTLACSAIGGVAFLLMWPRSKTPEI